MRRLALFLANLALPAAAQAQPALVSATPAAKAQISRPTTIKLSFSEDLAGSMSGIELTMTGMPGMANHQPMPIKGFQTIANGHDLAVTLPRPLPAGSYELKWFATGADQQRSEGAYTFTVR